MLDQGAARNPDYVQSLGARARRDQGVRRDSPDLRLSDVARATGPHEGRGPALPADARGSGTCGRTARAFAPPAVLELGYAYLSALSLPEVAQPHMETLVGERESSSSRCSTTWTSSTSPGSRRRIMTITIAVGTRLPAYATSMGRVLLSRGLDPDALAERLERIEVERLTATTVPTARRCGRRSMSSGRRAGLPSTRSSRRVCARRPFRFATAPRASWPHSTCRSMPPHDDACAARSCPGSSGRQKRSKRPSGTGGGECRDSRIGVLIAHSQAGRSVR